MSKQTPKKVPYLVQIDSPELASLLLEMVTKTSAPAEVAHLLADLHTKAKACAAHFAPVTPAKNGTQ